jgi:hypothetical protein
MFEERPVKRRPILVEGTKADIVARSANISDRRPTASDRRAFVVDKGSIKKVFSLEKLRE